ncbi:GIY-YIG nuclease family protein [Gemmatimonadota bacterium]
MSQIDRKARIREYKTTPRPAGIFRIQNTATGRSLIGSTTDLTGMLNRQRFQMEHGSHPDRELQKDWDEMDHDDFVFEILDQLAPGDNQAGDPAEDLAVLKQMWIDKLTASGTTFYERSKLR